MRQVSAVVLVAFLAFVGCLTGETYPKSYADAYCSSLFQCMDNDEIDFWLGYDDVGDCSERNEEGIREGTGYQNWKSGDCGFDAEAAASCRDEVAEITDDPDCGSMNWLEWGLDAASSECAEVYCD